jgi:1-acyl-sn-glycerol-3-phosphate acyltransferase
MRLLPRLIFRSITFAAAAYQRMFMDVRILGRGRIPRGPKIFVVNHVSSTDVYWILPVFREPVHLVLGPSYQFYALRRMLDEMEMISALPGDTRTLIGSSEKYLRRGESIVIAPEGDIQKPFTVGELQPGVAAIYRRTPVPIVPMALAASPRHLRELPLTHEIGGHTFRTVVAWRGRFWILIGEPFQPELRGATRKEQNDAILESIRSRLQGLLNDIRARGFEGSLAERFQETEEGIR